MAKARSGSRGVPRAERERQICDAAAADFATLGYAGTTIAQVAARADVSKPLVLSYFKSKEGLYVACCERAGRALTEGVAEALAVSDATAIGRGAQVLAAVFTALEPRPHDWLVLFDSTLPAEGPAVDTARHYRQRLGEQAAEGIAASFAPHLSEPGDLSALTQVWIAMVSALVEWWLHHPDQTADQMTRRSDRLLAALVVASR